MTHAGPAGRAAVTTSRGIRQITAPITRSIEQVADQTEGVWRPVAGILRWISPLGWTILALGVVCWVVGARWGWTELLMVAAAALLLFLVCFVLALGRTKVRILAEVDPRRVVVGEPATGRILVTNEARTPMLPILVELPVGLSAARFVLPALTPGSAHEELFVVPTSRRGVIQVGPATTVQGDPLGLMRRTLTWTERTELFVHPRTVALESLGAGLLRDLEGSDHRGRLDERPRLPRAARVPAGRRPPLHPLAQLGQGRQAPRAPVPRHPALARDGHRRPRPGAVPLRPRQDGAHRPRRRARRHGGQRPDGDPGRRRDGDLGRQLDHGPRHARRAGRHHRLRRRRR